MNESIFHTYLFLIPLAVMFLCEITKMIVDRVQTGDWHRHLFQSGGMPSTHSAFVTSLLIVIARKSGIESTEFAIAFCFSAIVWYDSFNVRRVVGEQGEVLNHLQHRKQFSTHLGHTFWQVIVGIIFGSLVTATGIWLAG